MELQRLDKLLAGTGQYSRKEAKALIKNGHVQVNGTAALAGEQKVAYTDTVTVDGAAVRNQKYLYIMLNKPAGVLCTTRDPACPTVLDLLPPALRRPGLFPAGRLDKDTEGFVLITDDGPFAHRMLSPRSRVPKTYYARLDRPVDLPRIAAEFSAGVILDGGDICAPAELSVLEPGHTPLVEIVIYEGMYHQIKRMFVQFSLRVTALRRVKIGGLALDESLAPGEAKEILHKEIRQIC